MALDSLDGLSDLDAPAAAASSSPPAIVPVGTHPYDPGQAFGDNPLWGAPGVAPQPPTGTAVPQSPTGTSVPDCGFGTPVRLGLGTVLCLDIENYGPGGVPTDAAIDPNACAVAIGQPGVSVGPLPALLLPSTPSEPQRLFYQLPLNLQGGLARGPATVAWRWTQGGVVTTAMTSAVIGVTPPVSVQGIKRHLIGCENWLNAAALSQFQYDDRAIAALVADAIRDVEQETQLRIRQVQIVNQPSDGAVTGTWDYPQEDEDPYTYFPDDYSRYFETSLKLTPVQSVQRVRVRFGNLNMLTLPQSWYGINAASGKLYILPTAGQALTGDAFAGLALVQELNSNRLPLGLYIDYRAGLPLDWATMPRWATLRRLLEMWCARMVLEDISELADAGLNGVSVGGPGSESFSYSRFMRRKEELTAAIRRIRDNLDDQETPVVMLAL